MTRESKYELVQYSTYYIHSHKYPISTTIGKKGMGNSMSYCVFPSNPAPVILLGLDGAGKTTILYKFLKPHDIVETFPTVGFNREQFTHRHFTMLFWDFGGKPVVRYYYQTS